MIYELPLSWVAIAIGVLLFATRLPGIFAPAKMMAFARQFPRHTPTGVVLTLIAGFWLCSLTATMDLSEMAMWRWPLVMLWALATVLQIVFLQEFLAVRALAELLLLLACVVLDAAFLVDTRARYVMTILAYLWIVMGMIWVACPYVMRDMIGFLLKTETRCRVLSVVGALIGLTLVGLGIWVY